MKGSNHGSALVQVLICIALLGTGLAGLASVQGRMLMSVRSLEWRSAAALMLYSTYDDLRARLTAMTTDLDTGWQCRAMADIAGMADGPDGVGGDGLAQDVLSICSQVQCLGRSCHVRVQWLDPLLAGADPGPARLEHHGVF